MYHITLLSNPSNLEPLLASCASVIAQMLDRTAAHSLICVMQPVTGYDNVE
jgi:hypothetical protein